MNIPKTKIDDAKNIMIVGVGSGFDVFTGLPFVYHWPDKKFVLVNSSPKSDFHYREATTADYPECQITAEPNITAIYSVGRHGVQATEKAYEEIVNKHDIQVILAVDGGVDSLATGNEESPGTILEDFIALTALDDLNTSIALKQEQSKSIILCCAGFGGETEEDMNHYRILENMAALMADGSFYGCFSLTKEMPEYKKYKDQCEQTWAEGRRKSHIQTKIISAAEGRFGDNNMYDNIDAKVFASTNNVFISPLSNIYWMFSLSGVVKHNLYAKKLLPGNTFADSQILFRSLTIHTKRSKEIIPL